VARILGIDYGERRVGLAVSDPTQVIARPLTTLIRDESDAWLDQLTTLIKEQEIEAIVVGYPLTMGGSSSAQTERVEHFIQTLQELVQYPIDRYDERLTSVAAKRALISQGIKTGHQKHIVDQTAAALLLQDYLDQRR
jgi:putative Holliday junction resolvase